MPKTNHPAAAVTHSTATRGAPESGRRAPTQSHSSTAGNAAAPRMTAHSANSTRVSAPWSGVTRRDFQPDRLMTTSTASTEYDGTSVLDHSPRPRPATSLTDPVTSDAYLASART